MIDKKKIKPVFSTYLAMLNVFPILLLVFCFIAIRSGDINACLIALSLFFYILFITVYVKSCYIIVDEEKLIINQLFRKNVIYLTDVTSAKGKILIKKHINRIELKKKKNAFLSRKLVIRTKWYGLDDIRYLQSIFHSIEYADEKMKIKELF